MKIAKRVLRYLAGTTTARLHMGGMSGGGMVEVSSYTDTDFAADKSTRKSVSGVLVTFGGMPVGWQVKHQSSVALSTAEAEFVAAAVGAKELLGVKNLLTEIGMQVAQPMHMMVDNQSAIEQIENETASRSSKHVDEKLKFVRGTSEKGVINPTYVAMSEMLADIFTKSLPVSRKREFREKIGVK
ncbi:Retrotransposon Polyprotein [Phytophthora palmivora]|uniref:Retrotransposon Polyprotein n=1 Tax=Phytophthora palmivora TaxID=4796 RepID=A0A2P4YSY9_9STRA|nr:Retrotransposon Polyprotein [Phytophthora palmivora]